MHYTDRELNVMTTAEQLLIRHGLAALGWTFTWNNRARFFGVCNYTDKTIALSSRLFKLTTDESAADTLLHELAHAIAPRGAGHGPKWRAACRLVGAKPERCKTAAQAMSADNEAKYAASFKYTATCPDCTYSFSQSRAPRAGVCCGRCHKARRVMTRFVIVQNR